MTSLWLQRTECLCQLFRSWRYCLFLIAWSGWSGKLLDKVFLSSIPCGAGDAEGNSWHSPNHHPDARWLKSWSHWEGLDCGLHVQSLQRVGFGKLEGPAGRSGIVNRGDLRFAFYGICLGRGGWWVQWPSAKPNLGSDVGGLLLLTLGEFNVLWWFSKPICNMHSYLHKCNLHNFNVYE